MFLRGSQICALLGLVMVLIAPVYAQFSPFQPLPKEPPIPANNPMSAEKIALGKNLYFDSRLSINGTVSCNSCHNIMAGGDDGRAVSQGALTKGKRSAPTVWNAGFHSVLYWDGRAVSFEDMLRTHLLARDAMAMPNANAVVARIAVIPGYQQQFAQAFNDTKPQSYENITKALAAFLRTLVTPDSAFDRYLNGEKSALSETALRGYDHFINTGCASCHFWVNFAGPVPGLAFNMGEGFYELFPNYVGSAYERKYKLADDLGRYHVTKQNYERRMWRVPSLRNIALTAPYFHNGSVASLDEAVRVMAVTQLKKQLTPQEVSEIVEFLNSLTGNFPEQTLPRLPETRNFSAFAATKPAK